MYFLYYGGGRRGPYLIGQIRDMWVRGFIPPDTVYWNATVSQWRPVGELLQLPAHPPQRPIPTAPPRFPATFAGRAAPPHNASSNPGNGALVPILLSMLGVAFVIVILAVLGMAFGQNRGGHDAMTLPSVSSKEEPATQVATRTLPSTVVIRTKKMLGSGFLVAANVIVTNFHVIDGAKGATVQFSYSNVTYPVVRPLMIDKVNDLALLEVNIPGRKALPMGSDVFPQIGTDIYVIGSPEGLANTFSKGNISQVRIAPDGGGEWLQFTAPISHGSSGGPLLNTSGEVIGITVATSGRGPKPEFRHTRPLYPLENY